MEHIEASSVDGEIMFLSECSYRKETGGSK